MPLRAWKPAPRGSPGFRCSSPELTPLFDSPNSLKTWGLTVGLTARGPWSGADAELHWWAAAGLLFEDVFACMFRGGVMHLHHACRSAADRYSKHAVQGRWNAVERNCEH